MNENENGTFGEYTGNADVPDTAVSNHPVLQQLKDKIEILQNLLTSSELREKEAVERFRSLESEYRENEGKLQDILIEALGDEEVDKDVADKIAELYGLDLRKVFSINIELMVNVEVSAPVGTDPQDIVDNVGFGYGGITYSGVGDLESDHWEVADWEEV
jgi:uncharacterized protein involved in exopolysaccharide biosynthesis